MPFEFVIMYSYLKAPPKKPSRLGKILRTLPVLIFTLGLMIITYAGWPIISYQLSASQFKQKKIITPYFRDANDLKGLPLFGVVGVADQNLAEIQNWLPVGFQQNNVGKIRYYNLSIPKLGVFNATVEVGGEDLSRNLVQYGGTAYPGNYGNAVIFGHSVLPQFFNPKDYMTIFSTLPTLKIGDEILVDFDGVRYRFLVSEMVELPPDDLAILEQHYDDSYISLVTCVPPGTYLRRLVVRARLAK